MQSMFYNKQLVARSIERLAATGRAEELADILCRHATEHGKLDVPKMFDEIHQLLKAHHNES